MKSIHVLTCVIVLLAGHAAMAEPLTIDDSAALAGIDQADSVFLIDFTNPRKTAFYMEIIEGTRAGLIRQGVDSNMVLVYIGQTVSYLTSEPTDMLVLEYEDELERIQASAKRLHEAGVRMEVCAVATEVFDIDNETILPEMDVVADGFISLIGWQAQGHHLVPIF